MIDVSTPRSPAASSSQTATESAPRTCLHHLVERQTERTPEALALLFGEETLSYRQLDRRANQLARHLSTLGVGPEVVVGLATDRCLEMVVGLLGILKAGAAYLPLDPSYPRDRLAFMLADARIRLLLTRETLVEDLPPCKGRTLCLDTGWETVARQSPEPFNAGAGPDHLAYVIYTSGSTGRPKGVQVPHRGFPNLAAEQARAFSPGSGDRVLQFASLSFDASTFEIVMALAAGATLCLGSQRALLPGSDLLGFLRQEAVSIVTLTPSALAALPVTELPDLRTITVAGEACPSDVVTRWATGRRFFNLYGPTEATIWSTIARCRPGAEVSIGRAIAETETHLLDRALRPVPRAETGAIFLGGVGVTRGYLHRPQLTAERFIPDPFSSQPGARLYDTGDLARWRDDGEIDFLGRADHQVKIRGFRVELGEVEAAVREHPAIREAVVEAGEDASGDRILVVYGVLHGERTLALPQLRRHLGEALPEHMLPAAFVPLEALPLMPSGKVDRAALRRTAASRDQPPPDSRAPDAATAVAPDAPVADVMAGIWAELLGLEEVGPEDEFFNLGGHSLMATRLAARVRDTFRIDLPLDRFFETPTLTGLSELVDGQRRQGQAETSFAIPRASRTGPLPLTFSQERVWFMHQLNPQTVAYNSQCSLRFRGRFVPRCFERALSEVVRRHEILRTTFPTVDGRPVQVVHDPWKVSLPRVDLTRLPADRRDAEMSRQLWRASRQPYRLDRLPLLRWVLVVLGPRDHLLFHMEHHLVHDGWSFLILLNEAVAFYRTQLEPRSAAQVDLRSVLPELDIQYADFACWQRQWIEGPEGQRQVDFWKRKLAGSPPVLALPTDRPRPPVQSLRGATLRIPLPAELYVALRRFSGQHDATLFMSMFAAFLVQLHRYTGQVDLCVGSAIANRRWHETETLIGMVVNTVVLRTDAGSDPTFVELLERVGRVTLEAYAHQDLPFDRAVQAIDPDRDLSYNPLSQVMFSFHDAVMPELELPDLSIDLDDGLSNGSAKFDMHPIVIPRSEQRIGPRDERPPEGMLIVWEYSTDLFDASTAIRMVRQYRCLLESLLETPEARLSELPVLPPPERHQLLVEWNDTAGAAAPPLCHRLLEVRAVATPDAVAVVFTGDGRERRQLTYRQLDRQADRLAGVLRRLGIGPEARVALHVERSLEMVVGILGVLKAGAAYVPLDPAYPRERLAFVLDEIWPESGPRGVLLTHQRRRRGLPAHRGHVVCLDSPWDDLTAPAIAGSGATAENPAYVIYTSGSTGRPKGVAMRHGALAHLIAWQLRRDAEVGRGLRTLQFASPSFDVSAQEMFATWGAGGTLVLVDEEVRRDTAALLDLLQEEVVERLFLPFVALQQLAETAMARGRLPHRLRRVVTAGEALQVTPDLVRLFEALPDCALENQYGPTESHVVTAFPLAGPPRRWPSLPPIGHPIAGAEIFICDPRLETAPIGVPGEVFIAGSGLARGYLERPGLTAERFVPHPFGRGPADAGARLYKSGDLARYLSDGAIEFLGRRDHQVKVRGFRVELGEIEARLAEHPSVGEAVATVRPAGSLVDKRLVAYVVAQEASPELGEELRRFLRRRLPDYMVPSVFVPLEALPLTPSGKVDRAALPDPKDAGPATGTAGAFTAPRSLAEAKLAAIWGEVLGCDRVSADADFFKLGGHSMLATRVTSRIHQELGLDLPVRTLFEAPTVAALARRIEEIAPHRPAPPILPRSTTVDEMPLSFAQERLWVLDRLVPGEAFYNIPILWRLSGPLAVRALEHALGEIVGRHEALRTRLPARDDGRPAQVIAPSLEVPLPVIDLGRLSESRQWAEVRRLASAEALRPFDLGRGPLVRTTLVQRGERQAALLLTLHHAVADGESLEILQRELRQLYEAFAAGRPSPLEQLTVQYADYAQWQRRWLTGEVVEEMLAYWRRELDGAPVLELPTDRPRPAVPSFRGDWLSIGLGEALSRDLQALSERHGATLFMTLLASFQALLGRLTGQRDVVVGVPSTHRNRTELEPLIGLFVNTLALRGRLADDPRLGQLLDRTRETTLTALAHQDLPFEQLVESLELERDLSRNPLVQVVLAQHGAPPPMIEAAGLTLQQLRFDVHTVRFDLEVHVWEQAREPRLDLVYNRDLFDRATARRLGGHYRTLLAAAAADPSSRTSELPLLSAAQTRQILVEWDPRREVAAGPTFPRRGTSGTLAERFEARVERHPDAVAVVSGNARLSYRELDRRAAALARQLVALGVGPERLVALLVERSPEFIVGVLGILKAGGAYLPLDPVHPAERLALILDDAEPEVLLTRRELLATVSAELGEARPVLLLDGAESLGEGSEGSEVDLASRRPRPEHLAYVIYTSGSTGRPKGTLICHRQVTRLFDATRRWFDFDAGDVWTLFHSTAFDFSVWEIWGALLYGGRLVLVPHALSRSPADFYRRLVREKVTVLNQTPSAFRQLVAVEPDAGPSPGDPWAADRGPLALRWVILGGEAVDLASLAPWFERHGDRRPRVVNMYGITETTVHVTYRCLSRADLAAPWAKPLGRPIPDLGLRLLDPRGRPVPVGVGGEIQVAGAGLARGYLARRALTAERFVPDPFSPRPGERLYRSGDLARWLAGGQLDYLGRIDHQIKLRGFRIEPAEIEARLAEHPAVAKAVVLAYEPRPGDVRLAAYLVRRAGGAGTAPQLRDHLKSRVPDYMIPAAFVFLDQLPLTANGKVDRRALPPPSATAVDERAPEGATEKALARIWREVLGVDRVDVEGNFFDLGGNSLLLVQVHQRLPRELGREASMTELFRYPSIRALARYLDAGTPAAEPAGLAAAATPATGPRIAIIGMAGRFPGADSVDAFWDNLCRGVESISHFSDDELLAEGFDPELLARPGCVKAQGVLDGVELFDAEFFGYTRREAELMDPQHRLFLETAWQALDEAGYPPGTCAEPVGVFAGAGVNAYSRRLAAEPAWREPMDAFQLGLGGEKDFLATRVAYKLDLKGPALTVQTACSTSLVAVHLAVRSLMDGECSLALAGGVALGAARKGAYLYEPGGIASPDGRCRPFDARAEGTVRGAGVGAVVLKPLDAARRDGDHVYAVIRGSAINNDGSDKVGYTAPSVTAQAAVISRALAVAEVAPSSVGYVEGHGTATPLGDPIEVAALNQAFGGAGDAACALGSLKGNVGHLDAAAGVAGLIKAALAVHHGVLPPSLHFEHPNPEIDFAGGPFHVNTECRPWPTPRQAPPRNVTPRRAGVSSFGIGGTNAHVVLEQAPLPAPAAASGRWQLLVLSGRTPAVLERTANDLADHLEGRDDLDLADVAYTLQVGRRSSRHRRAVVARDRQQAVAALRVPGSAPADGAHRGAGRPAVAFLFPGQGAQYVGMGRGLERSQPVFHDQLERCAEGFAPHLGVDLRQLLYPEAGDTEEAARTLRQTRYSQPALFAVEYALARLWQSWGVEPAVMIGHSLGEYVAACLAGVFSLEQGAALVAARGRLMQEQPAGAMLAVSLPEDQLVPLLGDDLSLAAVNAPARCVAAGPREAIDELERRLAAREVPCRRLVTSHAFHSAMMNPVLRTFTERLREVELRAPEIPFISNLTGRSITDAEATDPAYWTRHLRATVRFTDGVGEALDAARPVLLEVGPGRGLSSLVRQHPAWGTAATVTGSMRSRREVKSDDECLLGAAGALWTAGVELDWPGLHGGKRRRVSLPSTPFERRPYWIETGGTAAGPTPRPAATRFAVTHGTTPVGDGPVVDGAEPETPRTLSRRARIETELAEILRLTSGIDLDGDAGQLSFSELGLDSLALIQLSQGLRRRLGVELPFRRLLEELETPAALVSRLDAELAPDWGQEPVAPPPPPPTDAAAGQDLAQAVARHTEVLEQQLDLLRRSLRPDATGDGTAADPAPATVPAAAPGLSARPEARVFGPWRPWQKDRESPLTPHQQRHLEALIERYNRRTTASKRRTQKHRAALADVRVPLGFRRLYKELVYPIVGQRTAGSRLWDVDGNEYVDLVMGFGVNLLGHSPPFITEAVAEQLARGVHIGPQSDLAGDVAERICELTGCERVTFCNTGSEAVLLALRLARTVTGRDKIAYFADSYHGISNAVLARSLPAAGGRRSVPIAPGIPSSMVADSLVLDYGRAESLEILERHAGELAAVLVEPVQARRPALQPRQHLQQLRALTERHGIALIFDEMITGFRIHPGGAQAWFDVTADLATYGKVLGGGLPIGVVAGRRGFMDCVDGGTWQYGDDSCPTADQTLVAGTFSKHPLALAAARAMLEHLRREGPALQRRLNERTAGLAAELGATFDSLDLPIRVDCFASLFSLRFAPELRFADLLQYYLNEQGIYQWGGGRCFLSTAHSDADLQQVVVGVQAAVQAMQEAELLPRAATAQAGAATAPAEAATAPAPATEDAALPLLESQQALWFAAQMGEKASIAYNQPLVLRLRGDLDRQALEGALRQLVERHQALRTVFDAGGESQRLLPRMKVELAFSDLRHLPAGERQARAEETLRAAGGTPFDLTQGPLFRFVLLRLDAGEHRLGVVFHHLVVDGWSFGLLLDELWRGYDAERSGRPAGLADAASYTDYVRTAAEASSHADDEAYWLDRFARTPPIFEPPIDRPRPPVESFAGERESRRLPPSLVAGLRQLAGRHRSTLVMTLLAGYQVLLHRLTGQDDLVVGIMAAGQAAKGGASPLVGYCVQVLPLRSRLRPAQPFSEHLLAARRTVLDAYEHRAYPLARLIRRLRLERDPGRPLLVGTAFNLDRVSRPPSAESLEIEVLEAPFESSMFELNLDLVERQDELWAHLDYRSRLFDRTTIRRWLKAFERLLQAAVHDPATPVGALPLSGRGARSQLRVEWNDTAERRVGDVCLHEKIAARAASAPGKTAAVHGDRRWTYGELDRRSDRLAWRLRQAGVGAEVVVGVCLERSLELLAAVLGVLKAGAAYLPLDPAEAAARLAYILDDAGVPWVLTQEALRSRFAGSPARLLCLDGEHREEGAPVPCSSATDLDHLAYVIYTSGSTGRPKGVQVTHRAVANLLDAIGRCPGLTGDDLQVAVTTPAFDISVLELFLPLMVGARLVLADRPVAADGVRLRQLLAASAAEARGNTVLQATPATWRLLLAEGWRGEPRLKALCGGEALPRDLADRLLGCGAALWNLYGPTEATIYATGHRVWPGDGPVPIGRPLTNTSAHVLDAAARPVPVGVTGELYLGGTGVARGYLRRPRLTAERFSPDPVTGRPGRRLYRTGDLARYRADGNVEFLGRQDHQVKVRGFRIELGEIEAVLCESPAVEDAAVVVHEPEAGDQRLVAHVVPRGGPEPGEGWVETLRQELKERLPAHMTPGRIVSVAALPRTANGKLDRAAILRTLRERPVPSPRQQTPLSSAVEQAIAAVWREVLGIESVGAEENFFDLGGHSLLLIRVRRRLQRALDRELSVLELFQHPTVRSLAGHLNGGSTPAPTGALSAAKTRMSSRQRQSAARRRRRTRWTR